jgi:hypothetical protein
MGDLIQEDVLVVDDMEIDLRSCAKIHGQLGVIKKMRARKVPTPMKDKDRHRGDASKAVQRKIVVFHAAVTFGAALRWFTEDC